MIINDLIKDLHLNGHQTDNYLTDFCHIFDLSNLINSRGVFRTQLNICDAITRTILH